MRAEVDPHMAHGGAATMPVAIQHIMDRSGNAKVVHLYWIYGYGARVLAFGVKRDHHQKGVQR